MKFPRVSLVAAMGFAVFLVPIALVLAQTQQGIAPSGGLVPCGASGNWFEATACGFCDLGRLIQNIINFVIGLAIPIAALLFAWAGVLYFTAGGDTGKHTQALSIFKHTFLGFVLALTGWLIVQTILFSVFKGTYYEGWNNIQCVEDKSRIRNKDVSDLLKPLSRVQVVPTPPSFSYGVSPSYLDSSSGCVQGDVFQDGRCFDPNGTGESYDPSSFNPPKTDIASAASSYYGTDTSAGPENGNKACAWAVNNVLQSAGYSPIDANLVASMEQELQSGRGTPLALSDAQKGDIIVWKNDYVSHVGICQDIGCTTALSNSSAARSFTNVSGPVLKGLQGTVYRVNN